MHRLARSYLYQYPSFKSHADRSEYSEEITILDEGEETTENPAFSSDSEAWNSKYLEASIYLKEGNDHDKFADHPRSKTSLRFYLITHSRWFYLAELLTFLGILVLSITKDFDNASLMSPLRGVLCWIDTWLLLMILCFEFLKLRYIGRKTIMDAKTMLIKFPVALVLVIVSFMSLTEFRKSDNYRYVHLLSALKPILCIRIHYLYNMRRLAGKFFDSVCKMLDPSIWLR